MALRDLLAKFTIQSNPEVLDKINSGLDKTKQKVHEVGESSVGLEDLKNSLERIKHAVEGFILFEITKKIYEMAESFAKLGENIKVTAESMGLEVEKLQELQFAAGQAGVSHEQLATSMTRLSRHLYEAKTGSEEAQKTFALLGVPAGQLDSIKTTDQALLMLSVRLRSIDDPTKKLALTTQVLGRGSREMVAFLSQGPEAIAAAMNKAKAQGLTLSEAQVNQLQKMNQAFEVLHTKLQVIFGGIIANLSPVIAKLVDDFVNLYNANQKWISLDINTFLENFVAVLGFLDGFISTIFTRLTHTFPKGIFYAIFGNLDIKDAIAILISTLWLLFPVLSSIGLAVLPIAAAFAEWALAVIILDGALKAILGSKDEFKKTILGKAATAAVNLEERLGDKFAGSRVGQFLGLQTNQQQGKSEAYGPAYGAEFAPYISENQSALSNIVRPPSNAGGGDTNVTSPTINNTFHIKSTDPKEAARQAAMQIENLLNEAAYSTAPTKAGTVSSGIPGVK